MTYYCVELLDNEKSERAVYAQLAPNITKAVEIAKSDAINLQDKYKIKICYIHVHSDNEDYTYNTLTKTLHKTIKEHQK